MGLRRVVGLVLVVVGIVVLLWGGVFWKDRDTVVKAGPLELQTEQQKGVAVPPILGGAAVIVGIILVALPQRTHV
jgi:hypothetical protein